MDKNRKPGRRDDKKKSSFRDKKPYIRKDSDSGEGKKSFRKRDDDRGSREKSFRRDDERGDKKFTRERSFRKKDDERGSDRKSFREKSFRRDDERGEKKFTREKSFRKDDERGEKKFTRERSFRRKDDEGSSDKKSFREKSFRRDDERGEKKFTRDKSFRRKDDEGSSDKKSFRRDDDRGEKKHSDRGDKKYGSKKDMFTERSQAEGYDKKSFAKKQTDDTGLIRLNKYLAHAGIASRREADVLIESGAVKVNGQVVTEMGFKVKPGDTVTYGDAPVKSERKVYLVLNKPKDYITTVDDERDRRTVMDLIAGACRERVYPVGRLDRNTTGILLLTNDGELTTKLTHPKFGIRKVYHVTLNRGLKPEDFKKIIDGVELEDGTIKADDLAFTGESKKEIGIEIHSGRNRVVRRLFEHLGYDVIKLDRVVFAGLTKKDLPRGKWRFLNQKEVNFLKMIG